MPYTPGNEPEEVKKYLNLLMKELNAQYPDGLIVMDMWNHERWDKVAGFLTKKLGYPNGRAFLNAYGFEVVDSLEDEEEYEPEPIKKTTSKKAKQSYVPETNSRTKEKSSKIDYDPTTNYKGMVFCKECGARISKKAKHCPHCGAKVKKSIIGRIVLGIVITLLIFIVIAFFLGKALFGLRSSLPSTISSSSTSSAPSSSSSSSSSNENILQAFNNVTSKAKLEEITPPEIVIGDFGIQTICGSMKNISGKTLTYAQITFALYDSDGAQIGTAVANINNLTADSVWKYSASPLTTESWSTFQLTETTTW